MNIDFHNILKKTSNFNIKKVVYKLDFNRGESFSSH